MDEQTYAAMITIGTVSRIAEEVSSYCALTERHMYVFWHEQKALTNLKTLQNETVTVLSPGAWNGGDGPAFKDAELIIGDTHCRGDVALHLTADTICDDTAILNVVFWRPRHPKQHNVPTAVMVEALPTPYAPLIEAIDLELYPYKKFVGSGRCAQQLFCHQSPEQLSAFFSGAALWRLVRKHQRLRLLCNDDSTLFPAAVAMALGYSGNSTAFFSLYQQLSPLAATLTRDELLAQALGATGFFNANYHKQWHNSPYYEQLNSYWNNNHQLPPISLKTKATRPHNHPVRRLACLAMLVASPRTSALYGALAHQWEASWHHAKPKALRDSLTALLPSFSDDYWSYHYTFECQRQTKPLSLVGNNTKAVILVNAFFPLLYQQIKERGDSTELDTMNTFYSTFSPQKTGKGRYLAHRFFGDNAAFLNNEKLQQGAYQLHSDFCIHYDASCEGCPFVDRYRQIVGSPTRCPPNKET